MRARRRGLGPREPAAVREPRRPRGRRRPDDEPVDGGASRRGRGERRARGGDPAERPRTSSSQPSTPQRPPRGRCPCIPTETLQAGLAAAVAFDPWALAGRERRGDEPRRRRGRDGGGHDRLARRRDERRLDPEGTVARARRRRAGRGRRRRSRRSRGRSTEQLLDTPRGILTLLTGEDPQPLDGLLEDIAATHPELELEVHDGGQPGYPLLLGAE